MVSGRLFPWGGEVSDGLYSEGAPALLQAVPAQWGFHGPALKGCVEELAVADGGRREGRPCLGQKAVWRGGLSRSDTSTSMCVRS